jgi:23S rRNA A2030 N6-methylase RlmJ
MLYRAAKDGHVTLADATFETLTVADKEEAEIAATDGWQEADDILAPKPKRGRSRKSSDGE